MPLQAPRVAEAKQEKGRNKAWTRHEHRSYTPPSRPHRPVVRRMKGVEAIQPIEGSHSEHIYISIYSEFGTQPAEQLVL